jgi:hypothetical protein
VGRAFADVCAVVNCRRRKVRFPRKLMGILLLLVTMLLLQRCTDLREALLDWLAHATRKPIKTESRAAESPKRRYRV